MQLRTLSYLAFGLWLGLPTGTSAQINDLQASYDFLVRPRADGGALLNFQVLNSAKVKGDYLLPGSYYDSPDYWGAYVCQGSHALCGIHDTYSVLNYQLSPAPGPAGKLQVERVNTHNSVNIYDAATWQIAIVLGAARGKLHQASGTSVYGLATGLSEVLRHAGFLHDANTAPGTRRAVTVGQDFIYNGTVIANGRQAFAFRALAPKWIARDPLMESRYASWIMASNLPPTNPDYDVGKITWSDWKPITGENAWAFLVGPLQAAYVHYVLAEKGEFVPFKDLAVQNALDVLPTFAAMQSALGGVYYAPAGTISNEGGNPINPHEISVENNFSVYAGLQILRSTLHATRKGDANLSSAEKERINDALRVIEIMIGGNKHTKGLLSFFQTAAWQSGGFVQGGLANDPGQSGDWIPATGTKAVDVQTWGISALGAKQIDAWFGFGAAFAAWQALKQWGAYGEDTTLWGVGYSDRDGNGLGPDGAFRQGVMSAEWTAGAINAVRNMIAFYGAEATASPNRGAAQTFLDRLRQDEAAMLKALHALRIDQYPAARFPGMPPNYATLIAMKTKPYLYASRRYHIPFGWYANPLPSTASTAWVIMIAYAYDPFGFGGAPN